jgi:glucokinase
MSLTIGVDIGGTKIAGGLVDATGAVLEKVKVDSPATDPDAIAAAVEDVVRRLRAERDDVTGIGVSAAGFVDAERSKVYFAPNIAWRDVHIKDQIETRTGLPVVVENDGNAAAWGEFSVGAAQDDTDDILLVTVGTGVGGGVVMDGHLYRGTFGVAGEIGHIRVEREGRLCGCGLHGCLEQYGSGSALVADTRAAVRDGASGAEGLLGQAGGDVERITGPMITLAAQAGDAFAQERLAVLGGWLGEGIASLVAVLDPGVVIIGGGVCEAGDLLLDPVRSSLEQNLTGHGHRPVADVRAATLGNDAGMIGAAQLARG